MEQAVGGTFGFLYAVIMWLIVGLLIGAAARFLLPGPDPAGLWQTLLYGVAGSFVGGFIARLLGLTGLFGFVPMLAVAILAVWLNRKRHRNVTV